MFNISLVREATIIYTIFDNDDSVVTCLVTGKTIKDCMNI